MRFRGIGIAVAVVAVSLLAPAAGLAAKGDVYAVSRDLNNGEILKFTAAGGDPQVLTSDTPFSNALGMAMDPSGALFVADTSTGEVYRVDRSTGDLTTFLSGPPFDSPFDVAVGADRKLYVADENAGALFRVDPTSKAVSQVGSDLGFAPTGVVVARSGVAYVSDYDNDAVVRVDLETGAQTGTFADPLLEGPEGLTLSPNERSLYAAGVQSQNLVRFDVRTGAANQVVALDDARSTSLLPDRSFLVSESSADMISRVDESGSPVTLFSDALEVQFPYDTVVEPPRCGGKLATVVGTTGRDKLKGSKFADVISTLGGNDKVNAGKGKDIVCGGKGKDKLKGGKGRDKLKGGKGKDKLNGGPGKDVVKQ